jgi:hypothetical protein
MTQIGPLLRPTRHQGLASALVRNILPFRVLELQGFEDRGQSPPDRALVWKFPGLRPRGKPVL